MLSEYSQNVWVNLVGFNITWYLCVFLGDEAIPYVTLLLCLHFFLHSHPLSAFWVVLVAGLLGFCIDLFLTIIGFYLFDGSVLLPPIWLMFLWFCFAATLRQSLSFFSRRLVIAAIFGALGGSSSYIAASLAGVVSFSLPLLVSAVVLAAIWMALFPILLWVSQNIERLLCLNG